VNDNRGRAVRLGDVTAELAALQLVAKLLEQLPPLGACEGLDKLAHSLPALGLLAQSLLVEVLGPQALDAQTGDGLLVEPVELLVERAHRLEVAARADVAQDREQVLGGDGPDRFLRVPRPQRDHDARVFGVVGDQEQRLGAAAVVALPGRAQLALVGEQRQRELDASEHARRLDRTAIRVDGVGLGQRFDGIEQLPGIHDP
jgi:hypothetical protein